MVDKRHHFLMVARHFARGGYATDGAVEGGGDDQQQPIGMTPEQIDAATANLPGKTLSQGTSTMRDTLASAMLGEAPTLPQRNFVRGLLGSEGAGKSSFSLSDLSPIDPLSAQENFQKGDYQQGLMNLVPMRGGIGAAENEALNIARSVRPAGLPPAPKDLSKITNPLDTYLPQAQKVEQLNFLTSENKPVVQSFLGDLDRDLGTISGDNVKKPDSIINKANRPSILDTNPWHDVEHIRDSYRFKTVLDDIGQLPEVTQRLNDLGAQIVKPDVDKMLQPKEFGWRVSAFDLRMPNGQLVEYYLPVKELEAAKKAEGHYLFEQVRGLDLTDPANLEIYNNVAAKSRDVYQSAWNAYLNRTGQTEADVRAALNKSIANLSGKRVNSSAITPPVTGGLGDLQTPFASRLAVNLPANTYATRPLPSATNAIGFTSNGNLNDIGNTSEKILTDNRVDRKHGGKINNSLVDRALSVVPKSGSPLHEAVTLAQQHTRGRP